jgi:hemerythrin
MLHPDHVSSELSAEERLLLDEEHARLERFLADLRDTCENFSAEGDCFSCSRAQVATCQGRLNSFNYDFLDLVAEHFENEEAIMLNSLKAADEDVYFLRHRAEHVRLMTEVKDLMRESADLSRQGNPSEAIRRLERKVAEMFGDHAHVFDVPFLQVAQGADPTR